MTAVVLIGAIVAAAVALVASVVRSLREDERQAALTRESLALVLAGAAERDQRLLRAARRRARRVRRTRKKVKAQNTDRRRAIALRGLTKEDG